MKSKRDMLPHVLLLYSLSYSFDLELPVECDDEYWDISADGGVTFRQPQDVPSRLAFFTRHIKLCEVLSFVSRTLYCIKKSKLPHEFSGKGWEESIVSHLAMTMKSIMDEMPSHRMSSSTTAHPHTQFLQ